jgi:hypothetical protein
MQYYAAQKILSSHEAIPYSLTVDRRPLSIVRRPNEIFHFHNPFKLLTFIARKTGRYGKNEIYTVEVLCAYGNAIGADIRQQQLQ